MVSLMNNSKFDRENMRFRKSLFALPDPEFDPEFLKGLL